MNNFVKKYKFLIHLVLMLFLSKHIKKHTFKTINSCFKRISLRYKQTLYKLTTCLWLQK